MKNEKNRKRKRAKTCRNLGLEYVSDKTNKVVPAKQQGSGCNCSLRTNAANVKWCKYHLTADEIDDIFSEFYKKGNYDSQNAFLFSQECNKVYEKKRKISDTTRRKISFYYNVKNKYLINHSLLINNCY